MHPIGCQLLIFVTKVERRKSKAAEQAPASLACLDSFRSIQPPRDSDWQRSEVLCTPTETPPDPDMHADLYRHSQANQ